MKNVIALIGWLLLLSGLAVYLYGVTFAIFFSTSVVENGTKVLKIPDALETVITTIGAILLTNLGAILGISIMKPNAAIAKIAMVGKDIELPESITVREKNQIAGVLFYIITLIACGVKWASATFKEVPNPVVVLIPQYGKTLIGIITAYLAFVLAVNSRPSTVS
ncbi:hypothetical protein IM793_24255 [Pedobacter sp. MR2016-19]|uniref:hypothetical protein n=1 Tax=Pedobacter sp. MR2016-19 TaxID=2780089 RepID=UPI001876E784|nr:hypothetical protein [Pedobacter sp. MR2016-19]MBE5322284.1 hypothetical protein [Pedobacter sp. MR2016-19]